MEQALRPGGIQTSINVQPHRLVSTVHARAVSGLMEGRSPLCFWSGSARRDVARGLLSYEELCSWLPEHAEVVFVAHHTDLGDWDVLSRGEGYAVELTGDPMRIGVQVLAETPTVAEKIGQGIISKIPVSDTSTDLVTIGIWSKQGQEIEVDRSRISATRWEEVERNYAGRTRTALATLIQRTASGLPRDASRLILFHGPPGTGKTTAIRTLLSEWRSWCTGELVVDPEVALHDYTYLKKLTSPGGRDVGERWRLVVAEDADRFIHSGTRATGNTVLDRLLNVTDGILGQGSQTIFLLTTNVELAVVNPALSRPGRCLAVIGFELFSPADAKEWLGEGAATPRCTVTLAELYQAKAGTGTAITEQRHGYGQYL